MKIMSGGEWPPKIDMMPELKRRLSTCTEGVMTMLDLSREVNKHSLYLLYGMYYR